MSQRGLVHVPDICQVGLAAGSATDYRPKGTGNSTTPFEVWRICGEGARQYGAILLRCFQNHVGRPVERTAESIMLSSEETYIRCQPVRIIRPISIIITITINITTTPPLEH